MFRGRKVPDTRCGLTVWGGRPPEVEEFVLEGRDESSSGLYVVSEVTEVVRPRLFRPRWGLVS